MSVGSSAKAERSPLVYFVLDAITCRDCQWKKHQ
ncbi:hypothetical protein M3J09_012343 [Ascochyta lentis]